MRESPEHLSILVEILILSTALGTSTALFSKSAAESYYHAMR